MTEQTCPNLHQAIEAVENIPGAQWIEVESCEDNRIYVISFSVVIQENQNHEEN